LYREVGEKIELQKKFFIAHKIKLSKDEEEPKLSDEETIEIHKLKLLDLDEGKIEALKIEHEDLKQLQKALYKKLFYNEDSLWSTITESVVPSRARVVFATVMIFIGMVFIWFPPAVIPSAILIGAGFAMNGSVMMGFTMRILDLIARSVKFVREKWDAPPPPEKVVEPGSYEKIRNKLINEESTSSAESDELSKENIVKNASPPRSEDSMSSLSSVLSESLGSLPTSSGSFATLPLYSPKNPLLQPCGKEESVIPTLSTSKKD
jgi:hypothetical protein